MSMIIPGTDTHPESDAVLINLVKQQEPAKRLAGAVAASNRVARQCKEAIRRANVGISDMETDLKFIEMNYGKLATEVRSFLAKKK